MMRCKSLLVGWIFSAFVLLPSSVFALSFEQQLVGFSQTLVKKLQGVGVDKVVLEVKGDPTLEGSAPNSIREILGEEFRKSGITLSRTSGKMRVFCRVDVMPKRDDVGAALPNYLTVQVKVDLNDLDSPGATTFDSEPLIIDGQDEIARFLGLPIDKGNETPGPSKSPAVNALVSPKQSANRSVARASEESSYGISVAVGDRLANLSIDEGYAFVEIKQNDEFGVKLVNDSDSEVCVYLTLDGIDSHWFQKKRAAWLVPPKNSLTVPGWQISGSESKPFKIVPFEKSVAALEGNEVSSGSSLGVIAASFYRCYKSEAEIPDGDRETAPSLDKFGIGESDRTVDHKVMSVERFIGKLQALVPIRYERP